MSDIKISIIIPVYNVEKYLRECLDSVVNQTLQEIEIICVNDGSPDNSLAILKEYASKDDRVIVISKENGGYASAINTGLDAAKGEFVQIVESDDYCALNMCEEMYNKIKDSDADFITADFCTIKPSFCGNKLKHFRYFSKEINCYTLNQYPEVASKPSYPWKSLYRLSFINENSIRMFQDGIGAYEDLPWNASVLSFAKKILYIPKAYYRYRLFAEGSSTSCGKRSMINYIKRRAQIKDIYIKNNVFTNTLKEYYWAGALNGCLFFLKKIGVDYKEEFYNEMKTFLKEANNDKIEFSEFSKKMRIRFNNIMSKSYKEYAKTETSIAKFMRLFKGEK